MITVVEGAGRTFWVAAGGASGTDTYYKGQIVSMAVSKTGTGTIGTVIPLTGSSIGLGDTSKKQVPIGVILGFNNRTPVYGTSPYNGLEKGVSVATAANQLARDWTGGEGMWGKNDPRLLIQIAEILPETVLRAPIYTSTYLTAITTLTASGSPTTTAVTTNSADFTVTNNASDAGFATMYCRTGTNAGIYRETTDYNSATAHTFTMAWPYTPVLGDTFVKVPLKQGMSMASINTGLWIDNTVSCATSAGDLFNLFVYKLDLSTSGREYAEFRFGGDHFCWWRA